MSIKSPFRSVQSLSRVGLCDPMNLSRPGLPVHHQLPESSSTGFKLVTAKGHQTAAFLPAQLWFRRQQPQPEGKSCSWIVNPRGMCQKRQPRLGSPDVVPVTQYPRTHPGSHSACGRVLSSTGGETLRKEAGAGNPIPKNHGAQETPRSSSSPQAPASFACWRLDVSVGGPGQSSAGTPGPRGLCGWHTSSSSLSPRHCSSGTAACSGSTDVAPAEVIKA